MHWHMRASLPTLAELVGFHLPEALGHAADELLKSAVGFAAGWDRIRMENLRRPGPELRHRQHIFLGLEVVQLPLRQIFAQPRPNSLDRIQVAAVGREPHQVKTVLRIDSWL